MKRLSATMTWGRMSRAVWLTMKQRTRWEQSMRYVDELPPWLALGSGVAPFFGASLLLHQLPPWGFAMGAAGLGGIVGWLMLSGKPMTKLTWPSEFGKPTWTLGATASAVPTPGGAAELIEMIELPAGAFWMGSPGNEFGRYDNERRHRVQIRGFAMGRYPVTQAQYQQVMGENPSYFRQNPSAIAQGETLPVEQVCWWDAVRFCNRLSAVSGRKPCYRLKDRSPEDLAPPVVNWDREADGYRLPTEAEWEYACRAGTETAYSFGDSAAQLGEYSWFDGNSERRTHGVGQKKPNEWGLHDLHGNVWEWCWDQCNEDQVKIATRSKLMAPNRPRIREGRILRGGSFFDVPENQRSSFRVSNVPDFRNRDLGFRCVRGPIQKR